MFYIDNDKITINFDSQMLSNLKDIKAEPLNIIGKNDMKGQEVKIQEFKDSPDFSDEILPSDKGDIYYTSNKDYDTVEIMAKKSEVLTVESYSNNTFILKLKNNIELENGSILKFEGKNNKFCYSFIKCIKDIEDIENGEKKYTVELQKNNSSSFEYEKLRFCTSVVVIPIIVKTVLETKSTEFKLDFSQIINNNEELTEYKIVLGDGLSIFIDPIMRKNLLNMTTNPLKIIARVKELTPDLEKVEINKLCGSVKMTFTAIDSGLWGNDISIIIGNSEVVKTSFCEPNGNEPANCFSVTSVEGFSVGDIVVYYKDEEPTNIKNFDIITEIKDKFIGLEGKSKKFPNKGDKLVNCKLTITVIYKETREVFDGLVLNEKSPDFIDEQLKKSNLITVKTHNVAASYIQGLKEHPLKAITGTGKEMMIHLHSGKNGVIPSESDEMKVWFTGENNLNADVPGKRKGLSAFLDNDIVSMLCIPGVTNQLIQDAVINHCETLKSRIAILDIPFEKEKVTDLSSFKENIQSDYAAIYHPWLEIYDSLEKKKSFVPPSGAVAGIYARSDNKYGVHKAPANEIVKSITGLSCNYNKQEQDILNPKGINLIRSFSGQGTKVWGARTCSPNTLWKYVNVRRLFIYLEETIKANTNWIVFEPNNELLWLRVKRTIEVFLDTVWRTGALLGTSPEEAYYVDIGRSTMSQDDIDNGRLICVIGVAPVKPAEFVIFRLTQKTKED